MPASSLSNLSSSEVLQLAVQLGDSRVGLPASGIRWLLDWAGTLDVTAVRALSHEQLFDLVQLLAAATQQESGNSSSSNCGTAITKAPSTQLLGLLCWAAVDAVSTASAQQVYGLITALAGWRCFPPNRNVLLAAAATRVADKLPMFSRQQLSDILCGFAQLGFVVGEPLQSKLCEMLLRASTAVGTGSSSNGASQGWYPAGAGVQDVAHQQQLESTAAVLSAVLVSISQPPAQLVHTLMQQLDERLQELPVELLLQLGTAFAAAGMSVQNSAAASSAASSAASAATAGAGSTQGGNSGAQHSIPQEWGRQYLAAVGRKLQRAQLPPQQLAQACSSLQAVGLMADEATAEAVVKSLQQHLEAGKQAGTLVQLVPVVSYIAESRFRPISSGMGLLEQQLLAVLRSSDSSSSSAAEVILQAVPGSDSSSSAGGAAGAVYAVQGQVALQEQEEPLQLGPAQFVQLLKAMHDWGRRPGADLAAAAQDWSRHQLVECDIHTLGPLLLWLSSVCGKPAAAWMLDWVAVSQPLLQEASADDLVTIAVGLATSGVSVSTCSAAWWDGFSTGVLQQLQGMSDDNLEVLCSSCYKLKYKPSQAWFDSVLKELQQRVPDSSENTAAARALAWARQLKVA